MTEHDQLHKHHASAKARLMMLQQHHQRLQQELQNTAVEIERVVGRISFIDELLAPSGNEADGETQEVAQPS